jgi:hypothetical protein
VVVQREARKYQTRKMGETISYHVPKETIEEESDKILLG